ncbi:MAG: IS110 family transposase [Planctomycetota bacterium]
MSPYWKTQFESLKRRMHPNQAITAIARKLLVAIWHVLTKNETDCHASEEDLAWKMLLWSWSLDDEARQGLTRKQFAKYGLLRLGVQSDLTRFVRGKVARRIAPTAEVLERMTELGLPG